MRNRFICKNCLTSLYASLRFSNFEKKTKYPILPEILLQGVRNVFKSYLF
jgi:hypothetical protein